MTVITHPGRFFPVLGVTSDVPDLWSFPCDAPQGPSLVSEESSDPPGPVGMNPSGPDPPALRDKSKLPDLFSEMVSKLGTLSSGTGPVYFSDGTIR